MRKLSAMLVPQALVAMFGILLFLSCSSDIDVLPETFSEFVAQKSSDANQNLSSSETDLQSSSSEEGGSSSSGEEGGSSSSSEEGDSSSSSDEEGGSSSSEEDNSSSSSGVLQSSSGLADGNIWCAYYKDGNLTCQQSTETTCKVLLKGEVQEGKCTIPPVIDNTKRISFSNLDYAIGGSFFFIGTAPIVDNPVAVTNNDKALCGDITYVIETIPEGIINSAGKITEPGAAIKAVATATCDGVPKRLDSASAISVPEASLNGNCKWSKNPATTLSSIMPDSVLLHFSYGRCGTLTDGILPISAYTNNGAALPADGKMAEGIYENIKTNVACVPAAEQKNCPKLEVIESIFFEDFEGTNNWISASSSTVNRWIIGTGTSYEGLKAAYITNNDNDNAYTISSSTNATIYRTITFPVSTSNFTLSFYWKGKGEEDPGYDYMRVYLVPNSEAVTYSAPNSLYQIGNTYNVYFYNDSENWTLEAINLLATKYSGQTYKLVFYWYNDNVYGYQPPAAIDNILITY